MDSENTPPAQPPAQPPAPEIIKKPWQGVVLVVLLILGLLGTLLFTALVVFLSSAFGYTGTTNLLILTGALPFIVLFLVQIIGILKRKRWAVLLTLLTTALGTVLVLLPMIFSNEGVTTSTVVWQLLFSAVYLYLGITCLKHPYYNTPK